MSKLKMNQIIINSLDENVIFVLTKIMMKICVIVENMMLVKINLIVSLT